MDESNRQAEVRHRLQELTADDPAAISSMARHCAALSILLTGGRGRELAPPEPNIHSGFVLCAEERDIFMAAAARMRRDAIHIAFDVDDAAGPPRAIGLFRIEGEMIVCYAGLAIWKPAGPGRAVLVAIDHQERCHFVFRRGRPLVRIEGAPAGNLEAGLRRGWRALEELAASDELRDVHDGIFRQIVTFHGPGDWSVRSDRIAA